MNTIKRAIAAAIAAVATILLATSIATSQPNHDHPERADRPEREDRTERTPRQDREQRPPSIPLSADQLDTLISRRLDTIANEQDTLANLQAQLADGADPADIQAKLGHLARKRFAELRSMAGPRNPGPPPGPPVEPEEFFQLLREHDPRAADRLERLRELSPERFEQFMQNNSRRILERINNPKKRPPSVSEKQVKALAITASDTANPDAADARAELRTHVESQFTRRLADAEQLIGELEDRLISLRDDYQHHLDNREQLIDQFLNNIIARATAGDPQLP